MLDLSNLSWVQLDEDERVRYLVEPGDILLVRTNGNSQYVGRSVVVKDVPPETVFASYLIRLKTDLGRIRSDYLCALLNSEYLRKTLTHEIRSSAGNYNINTQGIKRQKVPLPPLEDQDRIVEQVNGFESAKAELKNYIEQARGLKAHLVKSLMMPDNHS